MSTINFTIISDFADVMLYLKEYITNVHNGQYGYMDSRLTDMPKVYDALLKWESKNVSLISEEEKEWFYSEKKGLEELMLKLGIDSLDVFIK